MKDDMNDDALFDAFLKGEGELALRLQALEQPQPSAALDAAILTQARTAMAADRPPAANDDVAHGAGRRHPASLSWRWRVPAAIAATVLVGVIARQSVQSDTAAQVYEASAVDAASPPSAAPPASAAAGMAPANPMTSAPSTAVAPAVAPEQASAPAGPLASAALAAVAAAKQSAAAPVSETAPDVRPSAPIATARSSAPAVLPRQRRAVPERAATTHPAPIISSTSTAAPAPQAVASKPSTQSGVADASMESATSVRKIDWDKAIRDQKPHLMAPERAQAAGTILDQIDAQSQAGNLDNRMLMGPERAQAAGAMLDQIDFQLEAGNLAQAIAIWEQLRQTYPDYPIPDVTAEKLRKSR